MRRLVLAAALLVSGCGLSEGTEPVGEPDTFATVTSVSRPPRELVDWMDTICGLTDWLADATAAGRALREATEADEYLTTAVVYVDTRLAQLTSLPKTSTDGDTLVTALTTALETARPTIVTLTADARTAPLADKLGRATEVAALLDQARAAGPSLTDLITTDPALNAAHAMARGCA